ALAVLALDVLRDQVHRTRAIQRDQRDHVFEAVGPRTLDQVAHAARFQLEHGGGVARREQLVGRGIIQRHLVERERGIAHLTDKALGPVEDGERGEAEEVEFHQADRLDVVLVELRDDVGRVLGGIQRAEVGEAPGAISTPPACMPTLRTRPSSLPPNSSSSLTSSSFFSRSASSGSILRASSSVISLPGCTGISFATWSQKL